MSVYDDAGNVQRVDDDQLIVLGVCGHWWQVTTERAELLDLPDCPHHEDMNGDGLCGRPPGVIVDWREVYPDNGRGPRNSIISGYDGS